MNQKIDTHDDSDDTKATNASRRTFLKGVSAAGLAAAGSQAATDRASAHHGYMDDYSTVIDLVEDAGADPTGEESINPLLEEHVDDDTMIILPNGRYKMDEQFRFTGFDNLCITGTWGTTIVPANVHDFKTDDWNYRLFRLGVEYRPGSDLVFRDIDVDQTAADTGIRVLEAAVSDNLLVENVHLHGEHDSGTWGPGRFVMTDSDGTGTIRNFTASAGGEWTENTPSDKLWRGPTGIICNNNKGTLTYENCELGGFPDNGLYAAGTTGKVIVDGGLYKNSQTASIRIGGPGSVVKNATIRVDDDSGRPRQRGIRGENSSYLRVVNCDIDITDPNGEAIKTHDVNVFRLEDSNIRMSGDGVYHALRVKSGTGLARIKNSRFEHNIDGGYSMFILDGDNPAYVEHTELVGDAGHENGRAAIHCRRDGSEFRALTVDQTGSWKRCGFEIVGDDCLFYKGDLTASHYPITISGDNAWIEGVTAKSAEGNAAVRLYSDTNGTYIKKNELVNGINGDGDWSGWGNNLD